MKPDVYWKVEVKLDDGSIWNDVTAVVLAKTRAQAVYKQWRAAKDAGYKLKWTQFIARRD
jgi:hypothetical protein